MRGVQTYAACGYCDRRLCLRHDGRMRRHRHGELKKGIWPPCPGSLVAPAEAYALRDLERMAKAGDESASRVLAALLSNRPELRYPGKE